MDRVVVGMSGGVDSSVAAALLKEQGYEVIGATMLVWSPPGVEMEYSDSCCGLSAAEDARRVCARLGIRHYTFDFKEVFYDRIIRNYVAEYLQGRTPNPCVLCNEWIKFHAFLERAQALGAERVATGHYARIRYDQERERWLLLRGVDRAKDQSYALYRLSQEQLSRTLFPLGEMTKQEVRAMAAELGLPTAGKPDSQETCFVPNNDYPALLKILVPETLAPGEIRSPEGAVLGRHDGIAYYTVGQRKRINVGSPVPLYVSRVEPETGSIVVAPGDHASLYQREVEADQVNLIGVRGQGPEEGKSPEVGSLSQHLAPNTQHSTPQACTAKIRYNGADEAGVATVLSGEGGLRLRMRFDEPVRAVTPGQSLVCYAGEEVLGGGVIVG